MPPTAKRTVVDAPPSESIFLRNRVARVNALRGKGSSRTPAEANELIDNLLALLPPGTLS